MRKAITKNYEHSEKYAEYKEFDDNKFYIFKVYDLIKTLNKKFRFNKSLDVGCADGSFSKKLKEDFGFDVYGIDISKKAVLRAKKMNLPALKGEVSKVVQTK